MLGSVISIFNQWAEEVQHADDGAKLAGLANMLNDKIKMPKNLDRLKHWAYTNKMTLYRDQYLDLKKSTLRKQDGGRHG